jgi:hypothetical protein
LVTGERVSGGFRVLASGPPAADEVISSGPLLSGSDGDWPGAGDVAGLRSLASALYGCVPAIADGPHADPATTGPLAAVIRRAASVIDDLAAGLTRIEKDLDDQAHTVSRYGVRIGTDRRPPPVVAVPPAEAGLASEQHWALTYQRAYAQATAEAQQARRQAARQLAELHATLAPPRASSGPPAVGSLTIGQFLTSLSSYLSRWAGSGPFGPRRGA